MTTKRPAQLSGKVIKHTFTNPSVSKWTPDQKESMVALHGEKTLSLTYIMLDSDKVNGIETSRLFTLVDTKAVNNPFNQNRFEPFLNKNVIIDGHIWANKYVDVSSISIDRTSDTYLTN